MVRRISKCHPWEVRDMIRSVTVKALFSSHEQNFVLDLFLYSVSCSLLSFDGGNNYFEISKNIDMFTTMYKELNSYYVDDIEPNAFMQMRNGCYA